MASLLELYNTKAADSTNGGTPAKVNSAVSTDTTAGTSPVDYFDGRPKSGADLFQKEFTTRKRNASLPGLEATATDPAAAATTGRSQWLGRALLSAFTDPAGTGRTSQYTQFKTIPKAHYSGPGTLPDAGVTFHNYKPSSTFITALSAVTTYGSTWETRAKSRTNPT